MVAASIPRHKPKARQPFTQTIAREFGRCKSHIYRVLSGERKDSPLRARALARQRELLAAARRG